MKTTRHYYWGGQPCTAKEELASRFKYEFAGSGCYKVTYYQPSMRYSYTIKTSNMPLIDATKNADDPKWSDLRILRDLCIKLGAKREVWGV